MLKANRDQDLPKLTIGDLCQAISDGTLPASVQNGEWYIVRGKDLRRFRDVLGENRPDSGFAA